MQQFELIPFCPPRTSVQFEVLVFDDPSLLIYLVDAFGSTSVTRFCVASHHFVSLQYSCSPSTAVIEHSTNQAVYLILLKFFVKSPNPFLSLSSALYRTKTDTFTNEYAISMPNYDLHFRVEHW